MLEYFKKKYEELLGSLFEPLVKTVLGLSWPVRLLIAAVLPMAVLGWTYRDKIELAFGYSWRALEVVRAAPGQIPLSEAMLHRVKEVAGRLKAASLADRSLIPTGQMTGWSAAQALHAIGPDPQQGQARTDLVRFIREKELKACSCWAELNNEDDGKAWLFISGWVLSALAVANTPASESEVAYVLRNQMPSGAWSTVPEADDEAYGSTFATAWAVIGLSDQLQRGLLPAGQAEPAADSIRRGVSWLMQKRQPGARWRAYPNLRTSSPSASISGLVIHALHVAHANDMDELDSQWLDALPKVVIPASIGENSYVEVRRGKTVQIDHFVQLTMPWMLIATVDSYGKGSVLQRTAAASWIDSLLHHESIPNADAEQENWWRAELAIAMSYLGARAQ